jgi:hypothetical protein
MAKFSQQFLRSLTQPTQFEEGLFSVAQSIGQMPGRKAQMQQAKDARQSILEMMNTNTRIAETGNIAGLEDQRVKLMGMLDSTNNTRMQDLIIQELSRVEDLRTVAKPIARKRDVNTLLRAEKSLKEADDQIASLRADTSPDASIRLDAALKAKQAIQNRINALQSDVTLVTEANNAKIDAEIAALTKDEISAC